MFPNWRYSLRDNEKSTDISFVCQLDGETWTAKVLWTIHHGSHVEFAVENRDRRFTCVIGPSGSGYFLALPEHHLCLTFRELEDLPGLGETVFSCPHLSGHDKSACLSAVQVLVKYDLLF